MLLQDNIQGGQDGQTGDDAGQLRIQATATFSFGLPSSEHELGFSFAH